MVTGTPMKTFTPTFSLQCFFWSRPLHLYNSDLLEMDIHLRKVLCSLVARPGKVRLDPPCLDRCHVKNSGRENPGDMKGPSYLVPVTNLTTPIAYPGCGSTKQKLSVGSRYNSWFASLLLIRICIAAAMMEALGSGAAPRSEIATRAKSMKHNEISDMR